MTTIAPIEALVEHPALSPIPLPPDLSALYGGELGFDSPRLIANFVESVDGVVALPGDGESGGRISDHNAADRFVMGLLRACADVVVVGAGTFRKTPEALWLPESIYPEAAPLFAELRRQRGMSPRPPLVVVTGSGDLGPAGPALDHTILFTTPAGAARLRARMPASARIVVSATQSLRPEFVIQTLRAEGFRVILTEGGPTLVGELVAAGLLDELFVTVAPTLLGRAPGDGRHSLVDGVTLKGTPLDLLSARRQGAYLFLRYSLR